MNAVNVFIAASMNESSLGLTLIVMFFTKVWSFSTTSSCFECCV